MNLTDKAYQSITPAQRAAATVAAMARMDGGEVRRLWQTAPRLTGWMADPWFTERMRAFERMALRVALSIEQDASHRLLCHAAVSDGLTPEGELPVKDLERLQASRRAATSSAKATWQAFAETCERNGLDPADTLAVFGTDLSGQARDALAADAEPTPAILEAMRTLLAAIAGEE